eukprot:GHVS01028670.1.p1 GENE.GHVS01028670.1~~GHVS01028670.1.p1  ORF type:complete len:253 (-),score=46.31 GHVS01028670.1:33-791(-)
MAVSCILTLPICLAISVKMAKRHLKANNNDHLSVTSIISCLMFGNIDSLCRELNRISCGDRRWFYRFTRLWTVCIKYIVPFFLLQCLVTNLFAEAGNHGSIVIGVVIIFVVVFILFFYFGDRFLGLLFPPKSAYLSLSALPSRLPEHPLSYQQILRQITQEFQYCSSTPSRYLIKPQMSSCYRHVVTTVNNNRPTDDNTMTPVTMSEQTIEADIREQEEEEEEEEEQEEEEQEAEEEKQQQQQQQLTQQQQQ